VIDFAKLRRWLIYLIGLTWTIPFVRFPYFSPILHLWKPSADDISSILDAGNKLLDFNIEGSRLRHLPDQPAHNPVERAIHHPTSFLDLALWENQSKTCYWPDQSTLGNSVTYRSGNSACQVPWSEVGPICNYVSDCRVSLCSCHARLVRTARRFDVEVLADATPVSLTSRNSASVRTRTVGSSLYNMAVQSSNIISSQASIHYPTIPHCHLTNNLDLPYEWQASLPHRQQSPLRYCSV
jgi:hypothetical protein